MARHVPSYVWDVDWDNNSFVSAPIVGGDAVDVSDYTARYDVQFGLNAVRSSTELLAATAQGSIVLFNAENRFNPDSIRSIGESRLRAPHLIRLTIDGEMAWTGRMVPTRGAILQPEDNAVFRLEGRYAPILRDFISFLFEGGGTVSDVLQALSDQTGVPISSDSQVPVGTIWEPNIRLIDLLNDIAIFAGGFMLERNDGSFVLITMAEAHAIAASAAFDNSYGPLDDASVAEHAATVRTRADFLGQRFAVERNDDGTERVSTLGAVDNIRLPPLGSRIIEFEYLPDSLVDRIEWRDSTVSPDAALLEPENDNEQAAPTGTRTSVRVSSAAGGVFTVFFRGIRRLLEPGVGRRVTHPGPESVYGIRPLDMPPWWPINLVGAVEHGYPWLLNLTEPLELVTVSWPELQDTNTLTALLVRIAISGRVVSVVVESTDQRVTIKKVLIVSTTLVGGHGVRPDRSVVGVTTRFEPPAPLQGLNITPTGPYNATVTVLVP